VQLNQIELVNTEPFERSIKTIARASVSSIAGFAGEKKTLAMLSHPRANSQFRIAVRSGGVDVVDTVFEQDLQDLIGLFLFHSTESGGAENHAGTLMPSFSEQNFLDHFFTSALTYSYHEISKDAERALGKPSRRALFGIIETHFLKEV
jgi:hypothetical protein